MEVDSPPTSSSPIPSNGAPGSGSLKRSNSAPMINSLVTSEPDIIPPTTFKPATAIATRRMSSSIMYLGGASPAPASPPIRGTDRIARLKQEEIHIAERERQHERETQSSLWISNNWDHLTFDSSEPMEAQQRRPRSFSESLHIMTQPNVLCGSPSPTRAGAVKQCFSPSMQIPVKNNTFTPSPSPSPTRKNFMRSLSPIAVRTGPLKRKLDTDGDKYDYISPPKKFNTGPATPDRIMTCSHPLANSPDNPAGSPHIRGVRQHHSSAPGIVQHYHPHSSGSGERASPLLGGRSPHSTLSVCSSSSSTGSNNILGGGGLAHLHPSGHSPLSSCSPSSSGGGGGLSPHMPSGSSSVGSHVSALAPVMLTAKQAFLFQPVTEGLSSPSSTSSSSSPSSSSTSLTLHHNQHHHHHHHPHHQHFQPQQQQEELGHHHNPQHEKHPHHGVHSDMNTDDAGSRGSTNDVYMTDSEMGEHQAPDKAASGFNFKPISPDHT